MKIETKPFAKALEIAADVIKRRNTIPILSAAKVELRDGQLVAYATDLDCAISARMDYSGDSFSPFTLTNPKAFARIFRAGGDELEIKQYDGQLDVKAGTMGGKISYLPADDLPVMAYDEEGYFRAQLGFEGVDMILRVAGAAATEETRYYLNGVYLHHVDGWTWRATATDGHRLYMGTLELPGAEGFGIGNNSRGVIIPRKWLNLLRAYRPRMNADQVVEIFGAGNKLNIENEQTKSLAPDAVGATATATKFGIRFHNGDIAVQMVTKCIDGTFPDYTRVIPTDSEDDKKIIFKAADMKKAIDAITAGATERTKAIKLAFDPKGSGSCRVSMKWIDLGFDGKIEIPATVGVKEIFEIGFNAGYLRQICEVCGGQDMTIRVADSNAPSSIASPEATDFRTVLMPMRV